MRGKRGKKSRRLSPGKGGDLQQRRSKGHRGKNTRGSCASRITDRQRDVGKAEASAITGRRLWLFPGIAVVVIPVLFLLVAAGISRLRNAATNLAGIVRRNKIRFVLAM